MTIYKGDDTWDSFIFKFKRTAKRYDWSSRKKADRLLDCLGGKALQYVRELHLERDFNPLSPKIDFYVDLLICATSWASNHNVMLLSKIFQETY